MSGWWLSEQLAQASSDLLPNDHYVRAGADGAEAYAVCGAKYGVRRSERTNTHNGYRLQEWGRRAGTIELAIPKLRARPYFPDRLLERRRRAEAALVSVVATSYLLGVSTAADGAAGRDAGITRLSKSQVFCRDLAGAYADGAATGAPQADQVADRWHLWHNLAEHVEKTVARHRECLTVPEGSPIEAAAPPPAADAAEGRLLQRARHRYEAVQALRSQGLSVMAITRELGLARGTVRRFARATSVEDVLAVGRDGRPSILDPFKQHLRQRWHDGVRSAAQLCTEIRALGYTGCYTTVRAYLQPFRTLTTVPPVLLGPPKVREVTAWMLRHPNNRTADEQIRLKQVLANSTDLAATARHISAFGEMISGHNGDRLNNWISQIRTDDLPHLHSFAAGLQRDRTAVLNGLTLHYSSGPVEGSVNRIKMIKRQMYGRAKFDLPRKRILIGA